MWTRCYFCEYGTRRDISANTRRRGGQQKKNSRNRGHARHEAPSCSLPQITKPAVLPRQERPDRSSFTCRTPRRHRLIFPFFDRRASGGSNTMPYPPPLVGQNSPLQKQKHGQQTSKPLRLFSRQARTISSFLHCIDINSYKKRKRR